MPLNDLLLFLKGKPFTYRLKIQNESLSSEWSNWLIQPTESYIEAERQGPYAIKEIEWIDINPIEKKRLGRLIPETSVDHTTEVLKILESMEIGFFIIDKTIRTVVGK